MRRYAFSQSELAYAVGGGLTRKFVAALVQRIIAGADIPETHPNPVIQGYF